MTGTSFRVGVNLTWLVPGVVGGSEEYTMRLLGSLLDHLDPRIRVTLYGRASLFEAYPTTADRYRTVTMPDVGSKGIRIAMEQTWLAAQSRTENLMHHAGGTIPLVRRQPAVVTIHDPQPLEFPENFHPLKRRWLGWALPYAVDAARLVVCPSRFTADRLVELLGVPEQKLRVVVHGHDRPDGPRGSSTSARPTVDELGEPTSLRRRGHDGRYLLYPAIAYPHKRHLDAVAMLAKLRDADPGFDDVGLVFTGRPGPMLAEVEVMAQHLGVAHRLHVLGRVPTGELEQLYREASALVFPSEYEGFGNPALEAMNLDCPVIVSDAGALPEVVGDAGIVVPVGDVDGFVVAAAKLLGDTDVADDLRRRGRAQSRRFEIGIAARQLAEVYGEVADFRRV